MYNRLVITCIHILRLLLNNNTNVNTIIKQTSSDRTHVHRAIKTLERAQLILETKTPAHRQKKIKRLTSLGQEVAEINQSLDKFNMYYSELRQKIKENFNIPEHIDEKKHKSMLLARGWDNDEINHYNDWTEEAITFEAASASVIVEALINRYAVLLARFNPNKEAKEILIRVITDALTKYLLSLLEGFMGDESLPIRVCDHCGMLQKIPRDNTIFSLFGKRIFNFMDNFSPNLQLNNRFIKEEAKKVIFSLFFVFKPPREYVEQYIKEWKEIILEIGNKSNSENNVNQHKQLLTFLEEINKLS
jgi:DNA-binding MarR family transcriptional regulator